MSTSPPGGKALERSVALSITLQLKADFKARGFLERVRQCFGFDRKDVI
jgi:hypothetical protein